MSGCALQPAIHRWQLTRLRQYDYTLPGDYFVTICTHKRQHLFGEIWDEGMVLNDAGRTAQAYWHRLIHHFVHIRLDAFVVMPNHIHGIIKIVELPDISIADDADGSPPGAIGAIIGNYKSVSTRQTNRLRRAPGTPVWQRNCHDRIIRKQPELDNARIYIQANPQNWAQGQFC